MCGICAGIGNENQIENVVEGLKKLEYRGYDSSGLAYIKSQKIEIVKSLGTIKNLERKIDKSTKSKIVIGHTRWATHGKVSVENAHPQICNGFAIVHNGIIENFEDIKKNELESEVFLSQTDTEVLLKLVAKQQGNVLAKLIKATSKVVGSFAVALLEEKSNKIFFAKRKSPLMIAQNDEGCLGASDISVFANKFQFFYILGDDEFAVVSGKTISFFNREGKKISKEKISLSAYDFADEKNSETHFMLKEIKEEPIVLRKTFYKYFSDNLFLGLDIDEISRFKRFHFVACGTAYHSCLMGALYIKKFCKKECSVSIASEFRYEDVILSRKCLYIFVSQSGETADTIACAKLVKEKGMKILCVTNVDYCSLNKLADYVLPTFAGKEIAVASTKAYIAQVFTLLLLALKISNKIDFYQEHLKRFVLDFEIPLIDKNVLNSVFKFKKIFYIGRQQDYVTSLESALKLKEIAYINCLGMPAGELKHGTLALIDDETLVIAVSTCSSLKEKIESNIQEVKARGGKVLLISDLKHQIEVDFQISLSQYEEIFMPIVSIVPLQLLAFEFSLRLGFDPDKPRNLAKSVTVE